MAERYVLDTGVMLRWYVDQNGCAHAREVLAGDAELCTPDFGRVELADVLRRRALLPGHLDRASYLAAIGDLGALVTVVTTDDDTLLRAAALSADRSVRLFDALFVVLALTRGATLLTSDAKLTRAVTGLVSTELLRGVAEPA